MVEQHVADARAADEVIGFHAQQAVEKLLKAVLTSRAIPYPFTHDLVELIDLLRSSGFELAETLEDVQGLNPFAATLRYDDAPAEPDQPFDREWALECVRRTRAWAESVLDGEDGS